MRLSVQRIEALTGDQRTSLTALLERAGVSRTAYYSLARRETVLPRSIHAIARALGVQPAEILEPVADSKVMASVRLERARAILERAPGAAFDNVWHTLTLLDLAPIERLNRSLIRGRSISPQF